MRPRTASSARWRRETFLSISPPRMQRRYLCLGERSLRRGISQGSVIFLFRLDLPATVISVTSTSASVPLRAPVSPPRSPRRKSSSPTTRLCPGLCLDERARAQSAGRLAGIERLASAPRKNLAVFYVELLSRSAECVCKDRPPAPGETHTSAPPGTA
jgi:hypothetical protein